LLVALDITELPQGSGPAVRGCLGGAVALSDLQDHWPQSFLRDRILPLNSAYETSDKATLLPAVFDD
jgi:hypothetical protein